MVNKEKQAKNMLTGGTVKRTVAGGLLGASIGYLATPENSKKLLSKVDQDKLKSKSLDFGKAAKDKSKQAVKGLKASAVNLFTRDKNESEDADESQETEINSEQEGDSKDYDVLKEENKELQDRLQTLEEKLDQLSMDNEEEESAYKKKSKKKDKKAKAEDEEEEDENQEDDDEELKNSSGDEEDENEEDVKKEKKKTAEKSKAKKKETANKSTTKKAKKEDEDGEDTALSSNDDTSATSA
jgi:hypothetical protein